MSKNKTSVSNAELDPAEILKQYNKLKIEYNKLELIVRENGLSDEVSKISDTEAICIDQIKRLKEKSLLHDFVEADAKVLDLLHKNLRMARGQVIEKDNNKKTKGLSNEELLEIAIKAANEVQ